MSKMRSTISKRFASGNRTVTRTVEFWLCVLLGVGSVLAQAGLSPDTGAVSGLIHESPTGRPIGGAVVTLSSDGDEEWTSISDDRGAFAIVDVPPGRYTAAVERTGFVSPRYAPPITLELEAGKPLDGVSLTLAATGVISGRVLDRANNPRAGHEVLAVRPEYQNGRKVLSWCPGLREGQHAVTDERGEFRLFDLEPGEYYLLLGDDSCNVAPHFYPGVTDPGQAVPVTVGHGAEVRQDMRFDLLPSYSVRFAVELTPEFVPDGEGFLDMAHVVIPAGAGPAAVAMTLRGAFSPQFRRLGDGEYMISGLAPGSYDIYYSPDTLFRYVIPFEAHVVDRDIDVGTIRPLGPNAPLSGRVRLTGSLSDLPAGELQRLRIRLRAVEGPEFIGFRRGFSTTADADGLFSFPSITARSYYLEIERAPAGAYLASATYDGRDVLANALAFDGTPDGRFELVVAGPGAIVGGAVENADGGPVMYSRVVLVPALPGRRGNPALFRSAVTDQNGRFSIQGVPPGEYRALAWEFIEPGAWLNTDFIARFESRSEIVDATAGLASTVDLTVIPGLSQ